MQHSNIPSTRSTKYSEPPVDDLDHNEEQISLFSCSQHLIIEIFVFEPCDIERQEIVAIHEQT